MVSPIINAILKDFLLSRIYTSCSNKIFVFVCNIRICKENGKSIFPSKKKVAFSFRRLNLISLILHINPIKNGIKCLNRSKKSIFFLDLILNISCANCSPWPGFPFSVIRNMCIVMHLDSTRGVKPF